MNSEAHALRPAGQRYLAQLSGILAPLSFLLLLGVVLSFLSPRFLSADNLKQIAVQAAVVAILACGQTAVIISGNIDLSVGAVMAFAGVVAAQMMSLHGFGMWSAAGVACASGLVAGALTGLITAYGRIPSFIVTLGMMGIAHGLAGIVADSRNIGGLAPGFELFGTKELFGAEGRPGIPYAVIMMVMAAVGVHIALTKTSWGRSLFAIGGNREAARLSGIRLNRATISVFALSGLLAGFAAIVLTSRTGIASMDAGIGYELYAVAAAVIGGTSLFGGQGGIPGTIIGAVLIYTIRNGCNLLNLTTNHERAIIGAVVILAVLYDRFRPGKRV